MSCSRVVHQYTVIVCILTLVLTQSTIPIFGAPQGPTNGPTQINNPIIVNVQTNSSVTITNHTGGSADFVGYISCSAPLMKVSANLTVTSSGWSAQANPPNIEFQGRNNVTFKFSILVPQAFPNGTIVTAQATIKIAGTSPARSYNNTISQTLVGTVLNGDNKAVENTNPTTQNPGVKLNTKTTKPRSTDFSLSAYVPIIAVLAVVGIIAGVAIKIMAKKQKKNKALILPKGPS